MYITEFDSLKRRIDDFSKSSSIKTVEDFLILKGIFDNFLNNPEINFFSNSRNYKARYAEVLFQLITKFHLEEYNDEALASLKETIEAGQLNDLDISSYIRMLAELQKGI